MGTDPIRERSRDLRAIVGEHLCGPLEEAFCGLSCDGCRFVLVAPNAEELSRLAAGWRVSDELGGDDFCPACAR